MRRDTQAVLLLLVGGTLLKVAVTGTYVRYVKPSHLPLLIAAGVVLVAVAGITLWRQIKSSGAAAAIVANREPVVADHRDRAVDHRDRAVAHHDRAAAAGRAAAAHEGFDNEPIDNPAEPAEEFAGHGHETSRVGWLLLAPALALLLFSPPALGSFQAIRNGTALGAAAATDFAALPAGDPVRVSLMDYAARAVFDHGRSLTGRQVQLTGFIIAGVHGEPYLARLFVGCCAADARPIKIGLTGDLPGILAPDQWVEVVGTYTDQADRDPVNGELIPYVQVVSVRDIDTPEEQYET